MKNDTFRTINYENEPRRDILCVDVKSFFASVEAVERGQHPMEAKIAVVSRPESKGGLVLAASPLVKKEYGIKTGSRVMEFPRNHDIEIVPPQMDLYIRKNRAILDIFLKYISSDDLHVYSIDEAFLDVTASKKLFGAVFDIVHQIQRDVWQDLGLIVTVGIGDNPLLSKLALDHEAKYNSDNHYRAEWRYEDVPKKLWRITPLSEFWGIGKKTEAKLNNMGMYSIYDVAQYDPYKLKKRFGVIGEELFFHTHGVDRTLLSETFKPKSQTFSKSQILPRDYYRREDVEVVLREMIEEVAFRLRHHGKISGLVHVGVGYSKDVVMPGFSRQMTIEPTNSSTLLTRYALTVFHRYYEQYPVRSVTVWFGEIQDGAQHGVQLNLFESVDSSVKESELDRVRDSIREKFGYTSVLRASSLSQAGRARERAKLTGGHASGGDTK